jgi:hypothetical protein
MQEHTELINMGKIKGSRAHEVVVKYGRSHKNKKYKHKYKGKVHAYLKKEQYSKPFNDSLRSKGGKGRKWEKCAYFQ